MLGVGYISVTDPGEGPGGPWWHVNQPFKYTFYYLYITSEVNSTMRHCFLFIIQTSERIFLPYLKL